MNKIENLKASKCASASQAIKLLGGPVEAARRVNATSYQAVQNWRASGVPVRFCWRVAELTGMSLESLRPSDWNEYWPSAVLAAQPKEGEVE